MDCQYSNREAIIDFAAMAVIKVAIHGAGGRSGFEEDFSESKFTGMVGIFAEGRELEPGESPKSQLPFPRYG